MNRQGSILLLVLVVVAALALTTQSYLQLMENERLAVRYHGRHVQARRIAESGVEYLAAILRRSRVEQLELGGLENNPEYLLAAPLEPSDRDARGHFTVFTFEPVDQGDPTLLYGLQDESSRLHLLACLAESDDAAARQRLLGLPGMDEAIADAILDWIDDDEFPREFGAEADYYQTLDPPVVPPNGPPASLDELLSVRGVTPALLYGGDTNRNGRLDDGEQAGEASAIDPSLATGWAPYLTLHSMEHPAAADLDPRVDVNQQDLQSLRQELSTSIGDPGAKFIVLYRQYGGSDETASNEGNSSGENSSSDEQRRGEEARRDNGQQDAQSGSLESIDIDYDVPAKTKIQSLLDLVDATVNIPGEEGQLNAQPQQVASPWTTNDRSTQEILKLYDAAIVARSAPIAGRINVNRAPRPVLLSLPNVTAMLVEQILLRRDPGSDAYRHPIWLWTDGVVALDQMKQLEPYVTTSGSTYRAQVVGFFIDGGPTARVEVVFDRGGTTPRIVSWRDWTVLGPGLFPDELGQQDPAAQ